MAKVITTIVEEQKDYEAVIKKAEHFLPFLEDISKEISVLKTVVGLIKAGNNLSDRILTAKIGEFLYGSKLTQEKIDRFKRKFSKKTQEQVWECVVLAVDNHDQKIKSEITGKLFDALIDEIINLNEFYALVHATNVLNVHTLDALKALYSLENSKDAPKLTPNQTYSFLVSGLIGMNESYIGTVGGGSTIYPLNQLGWKFVGIIYNFPESNLPGYRIGQEVLLTEYDENWHPTQNALPLSYVEEKKLRKVEADLFAFITGNLVLCDKETGLPAVVKNRVLLAGELPLSLGDELIEGGNCYSIRIRNMEDEPIQKYAYLTKTDKVLENTEAVPIDKVIENLTNTTEKNDYLRYVLDVAEEIRRHLTGELKDFHKF